MIDDGPDLSDFGGGVKRDQPNPEDEVNQYLSAWLRGDGRRVYWDRDRSYGNGSFSVTTRRRPDLVLTSEARNYAIEVKRSGDSANVHDGAYQAYVYWRDIIDGRATYSTGGSEIDIDAVLVATDKSPEGHLFHNWRKKDVMRSGRSEGAQKAASFGQIPQIEHATSETLIRLLHRFARGYDETANVGLGGLLSSALDQDKAHPTAADPAALFYTMGAEQVQSWEYIPFYLAD